MSKRTYGILNAIIAISIIAFLINKYTTKNAYIDIWGDTAVFAYIALYMYDAIKKHKVNWLKWAFSILVAICWLGSLYDFLSYLLFDTIYSV